MEHKLFINLEKKENDLKIQCGLELEYRYQTSNEADLEALFLIFKVRKTVRGDCFLVLFQESVLAPKGSCHNYMNAEHI